MRLLVQLVVASASAIACAWAFPPAPLPLLAWVAYVPLLVILRRAASVPGALLLAWTWLTIFAWNVGSWLPRSVSRYYDQPTLVGVAFFFGVSTGMAGLYYMVFAAMYRRLSRLPAWIVPGMAAAAWVTVEFGRAALLTGNPWGLTGYSQVAWTPVVQMADVTGVYGITFAVLLLNAAFAEMWLARADPSRRHPALATLIVAGALVVVVVVYGQVRLAAPMADGPTTRVAVAQGNLDVGSQWRATFYGVHLDTYLRLTDEVLRASGASLIVWPEGAMTFFLDQEPLYRRAISRIIARHGAHLVTGGPHAEGDPAEFNNAAFLAAPDGTVVARYDKQHLLPFAEYFPLRGMESLQRRFGRMKEFTPGRPSPPLPTPAGLAGILICNETFYGDIAATRVRDGAELLIALANDSWVADPQFSAIVFDMVRLRAVEERRWIVRASTSGPSGLIDPYGRVTVRTADAVPDVLWGDVRAQHGRTVYARVGDAFAWGCVAVTLVGLLVARSRGA
ncbi:MAG TPA: apolipoprotein N-acyltransferase [Candidatus Binatia bacterium]|jgi:apolipoprotein N-acyltransferase|nr:apolipoprotein N-acyltransferase [Candidatus Binatia bacterium]